MKRKYLLLVGICIALILAYYLPTKANFYSCASGKGFCPRAQECAGWCDKADGGIYQPPDYIDHENCGILKCRYGYEWKNINCRCNQGF